MIANADGLEDRTIDFEFGEETEVWGSCSLTWQNNHYVFGGGVKVVSFRELSTDFQLYYFDKTCVILDRSK